MILCGVWQSDSKVEEFAPRCRISRARIVDAGRIITASGMETGFGRKPNPVSLLAKIQNGTIIG